VTAAETEAGELTDPLADGQVDPLDPAAAMSIFPDGCDDLLTPDDPPADPPIPTTLVQRKVVNTGEGLGSIQTGGLVRRVCGSPAALLGSADDVGESNSDLTLLAETGIDMSLITQGRPFVMTIKVDEEGVYTLTGIRRDDGFKGAKAADGQGELAPVE
jgi:hypothetical protein